MQPSPEEKCAPMILPEARFRHSSRVDHLVSRSLPGDLPNGDGPDLTLGRIYSRICSIPLKNHCFGN